MCRTGRSREGECAARTEGRFLPDESGQVCQKDVCKEQGKVVAARGVR